MQVNAIFLSNLKNFVHLKKFVQDANVLKWPLTTLAEHITLSRNIGAVGGLTLNYGGQLPLYFPHMLSVIMTRDLAHMQLSDLQGEIRPTCRTSDLQRERILIRRT